MYKQYYLCSTVFSICNTKYYNYIHNSMKSYTNYIVNTDILKTNAVNIKKAIGEKVKLCAIVKANAYGLGVCTIAKSLQGIVDFFAVACFKEAIMLRLYDKFTPILVLGKVSNEDLRLCSLHNISITISSLKQLDEILTLNIPLNIHIKINTGLNRFGIQSLSEYKKLLSKLTKNAFVNIEGVFSHFATKSNDITYIKKQYYKFLQFKKVTKISNVIFHIANSFATIHDKSLHLDMVRSGFLLYGGLSNKIDNQPVLKITSQIVHVFKAKKGSSIGYDRTCVVDKNTNIGVVPVGYADGFDRRLSNNFYVLIHGKKCKIIGLVCMDCFMVDLGDFDIKEGEEVVLLGKCDGKEITLNDYANVMQTSPYEVLLGFNYARMNYIVK